MQQCKRHIVARAQLQTLSRTPSQTHIPKSQTYLSSNTIRRNATSRDNLRHTHYVPFLHNNNPLQYSLSTSKPPFTQSLETSYQDTTTNLHPPISLHNYFTTFVHNNTTSRKTITINIYFNYWQKLPIPPGSQQATHPILYTPRQEPSQAIH